LQQAENEGFDVLVTTDQNLKYQQNMSARRIAIVVLTATSWPRIQNVLSSIVDAVNNSKDNSYIEVVVPYNNQQFLNRKRSQCYGHFTVDLVVWPYCDRKSHYEVGFGGKPQLLLAE